MRGTAYLKEWEQRVIAEREAIVVTARCAFCDWNLDGTVGETRDAYQAHRTSSHPEVRPPARRRRHRPYGQLQGMKSLDENIAAAREQGAAGWDTR